MNFKNTRRQGDAGVAAALLYFALRGWPVVIPFGDGQRYDLVVDVSDDDGELGRVQCKTAFSPLPNGRFQAELRTSGGNRSGAGKEQRISIEETDAVTILDGEGRLWLFDSSELAGRRTINLPRKGHSPVLQLSDLP